MLHFFVVSYTYKIVAITSGIYLKTSKKTYHLSFFFHSSYLSILIKFYLRLLLNSHIIERCIFSLFISSSNQHSASCLYMKNEEQTEQIFGELNCPSCFPASRFHSSFSSTQLICHALSIHKVVFTSAQLWVLAWRFSFQFHVALITACHFRVYMGLLCVNNFCPGHEKTCSRLLI